MKSKLHILLGVAVVFVLGLGANLNNYAKAEDQGATEASSSDIAVSPSIDKLGYLKPGETYERTMTIVNPSDKTTSFKVNTSSFWVENESYELKWGVSESQYGKIAEWTDIDKTKVHTIDAGETYKFDYTITVPEDQAGGAQRLMVTIVLGSKGDAGFVTTETHINTLVYANIEGEIHPDAEILAHSIQNFSFSPSVVTRSTIKNTGDVDLDVKYKLYVADFWSGDEAYTSEEDKILMTDSTRMYEHIWSGAPALGVFNVTQEITLMGEVQTFTGVTIICPLWLVLLIVIAIVLIVIYFIHKSSKRKKQRA
ncbi:MAG: hypothetical protein ACK5MU_01270 [Candidatus Saccharimonadales bacterium]